MRGATRKSLLIRSHRKFQSTLLMRGATACFDHSKRTVGISIHAPHARSDCSESSSPSPIPYFNPRSSCEERRETYHHTPASVPFQSTLLMRGATCVCKIGCRGGRYFNPRSSCEERHVRQVYIATPRGISIHAPHARSDRLLERWRYGLTYFNPRSSCEERHGHIRNHGRGRQISIHAPHARSDLSYQQRARQGRYYFNPRSSCEERQC